MQATVQVFVGVVGENPHPNFGKIGVSLGLEYFGTLNFLGRLVEFRSAVRLCGEGRATGPPERASRVIRLREKSANRVSIPRHPGRRVSRAAPRTRHLATFRGQCGPSSHIRVAARIRCPHNTQYSIPEENTMRFMMIMFPKSYENAKPGWVPDFKEY